MFLFPPDFVVCGDVQGNMWFTQPTDSYSWSSRKPVRCADTHTHTAKRDERKCRKRLITEDFFRKISCTVIFWELVWTEKKAVARTVRDDDDGVLRLWSAIRFIMTGSVCWGWPSAPSSRPRTTGRWSCGTETPTSRYSRRNTPHTLTDTHTPESVGILIIFVGWRVEI